MTEYVNEQDTQQFQCDICEDDCTKYKISEIKVVNIGCKLSFFKQDQVRISKDLKIVLLLKTLHKKYLKNMTSQTDFIYFFLHYNKKQFL